MQDVRSKSGDVELAGTLQLPAAGAHGGAVALVHGSGPKTRDGPFGGAWPRILRRLDPVLQP